MFEQFESELKQFVQGITSELQKLTSVVASLQSDLLAIQHELSQVLVLVGNQPTASEAPKAYTLTSHTQVSVDRPEQESVPAVAVPNELSQVVVE